MNYCLSAEVEWLDMLCNHDTNVFPLATWKKKKANIKPKHWWNESRIYLEKRKKASKTRILNTLIQFGSAKGIFFHILDKLMCILAFYPEGAKLFAR